jgi:transcriptional regulator with XRE-family HTH domain
MMSIKELRQRKGLTQVDLASRVGIDPMTVSRIERGEVKPLRVTRRALAQCFGVSETDLAFAEAGR